MIGIDAITDIELTAHSSSGGGVDDPVLTTAQADLVDVDATIAGECVVPLRAIENIVPRIAGERVVESGALEVFDVAEDVALGIAAGVGRASHQADRHAGGRIEV